MAHTRKDIIPIPPLLLAIENSGMCGSVALVCSSFCIGEYSLQSRKTHSRRLLPAVQHLMEEAEVGWKDLDGIAVSIGPGSFTGLRIGLSAAKGLAAAASLPLIGISSLQSLAWQFCYSPFQICTMVDARKKEVYCAFFRPEGNGSLQRLTADMVLPPHLVLEEISEPTLLVGDGVAVYRELIDEKLGSQVHLASPNLSFPRAATVGFLALTSWSQNDFLDIGKATPVYIRPSEAEEKRAELARKGGRI